MLEHLLQQVGLELPDTFDTRQCQETWKKVRIDPTSPLSRAGLRAASSQTLTQLLVRCMPLSQSAHYVASGMSMLRQENMLGALECQ